MKSRLRKKASTDGKFKKNKKTPKTKKIDINNKMRGLQMPSGKLKWFNAKKGYGFITDDETKKDIFLHVSALEDQN